MDTLLLNVVNLIRKDSTTIIRGSIILFGLCIILGILIILPYYEAMSIAPEIESFGSAMYAVCRVLIPGSYLFIVILSFMLPGFITYLCNISGRFIYKIQYLWLTAEQCQELLAKNVSSKCSNITDKFNLVKVGKNEKQPEILLLPFLFSWGFAISLYMLTVSIADNVTRFIHDNFLQCFSIITIICVIGCFFIPRFTFKSYSDKFNKIIKVLVTSLIIAIFFIYTYKITFKLDSAGIVLFMDLLNKYIYFSIPITIFIGSWQIKKKMHYVDKKTYDMLKDNGELLSNMNIFNFCCMYYAIYMTIVVSLSLSFAHAISRPNNIEYFYYVNIIIPVFIAASGTIFFKLMGINSFFTYFKILGLLVVMVLLICLSVPNTAARFSGMIMYNSNLGNVMETISNIPIDSCKLLKQDYIWAANYITESDARCKLHNTITLDKIGDNVHVLMNTPLEKNYYIIISISKRDRIIEGEKIISKEIVKQVLYNRTLEQQEKILEDAENFLEKKKISFIKPGKLGELNGNIMKVIFIVSGKAKANINNESSRILLNYDVETKEIVFADPM